MGGSGRLSVDLGGLEQFASSLDRIRRTMDGTRRLFDSYTGDLGSGKVADALGSFEQNWKDGRKEIDGHLQGLSKLATGAVEEFRKVDGQLKDGLEKSTHTVSGGGSANGGGAR